MSASVQTDARVMVRARLLGPTEIVVGERQIAARDWPGRTGRSLLLLLLSAPGRRLHRDQVLDTLWPESEPEAALNALYKALHGLRRTLEPALRRGRDSAFVEVSGESIGLRPAINCWVDVDLFESEVPRAASLPPAERREAIRAALRLYRGEFLADEPYADWPIARREFLRHARERAILSLATLDLDAGEPLAAVPALDALLAADAANEEGHRALMRAYAAAGQRDLALRQFERCRTAVQAELGVEPSDDTVALATSIRTTPFAEEGASGGDVQPPPARFTNIPALPTPTVGRDRDIDEVQTLLSQREVRLVTITGPGGIGKTRLAIETAAALADEWPDGAGFVPLAAASRPDLVLSAMAKALGLREDTNRAAGVVVEDFLKQRTFLLILDNFEHLIGAAPEVANLIAACHGLTVLVTSREPLRVRGEREYRLDVLTLPRLDRAPRPAALAHSEAVTLFLQTIRAHRPDFALTEENSAAVAEICVQLDGLPLAIELAAVRGRYLSPARLLEQIGCRLTSLGGGPRDLPDRQRTIRDTIAWSHNLLTEEEQTVFRRLAVFAVGADAEAIRAVCGEDAEIVVYALADKSLAQWVVSGGQSRIIMLETIRAFAAEELQRCGELADYQARHVAVFADLADEAERALEGRDQVAWLERLDTEIDNFRAALASAAEQDDMEMLLRIAGGIGAYWNSRGLYREGLAWLERGLAQPTALSPRTRARAAQWAGRLTLSLNEVDRPERYLTLARTLWEELGNQRAFAVSLSEYTALLWRRGEFDASAAVDQQALALHRAVDNPWGIAHCLVGIGAAKAMAGRHDEAFTWYLEGLKVCHAAGDVSTEAWVETHLGMALLNTGDLAGGAIHAHNTERLARLLDDRRKLGDALYLQAGVAFEQHDYGQGRMLAAEAAAVFAELGNARTEAIALFLLGACLLELGLLDDAVATYGRAFPFWISLGAPEEVAACLQELAPVALALGRAHDAVCLLGAGDARRAAINAPTYPPDQVRFDATLSAAREQLGHAATEQAWQTGQDLSLEDVIALAMDVCQREATASAA